MFSKLRSRLTYANVMATFAVFVALGGSSYAALRVTSRNVPKDALTGADIKNLTGKDMKNNSVTGADVRDIKTGDVTDGSLLGQDFKAGQLPKGDKGDPGTPGAVGEPGSDAASALIGRALLNSQASAVCQFSPSGDFAVSTTCFVGGLTHLSPNATLVARDLSVKLDSPPGGVASRRFVLVDDNADTTVECTVSGSATTCNSGAAQATISPGSLITIKYENSATAPATSYVHFGWRATTP